MTYCVAIKLNAGLVLLSDTRTNAGLDNISRYSKMHCWEAPGERVITLLTAGNLSITQGVVTRLEKQIEKSHADPGIETIMNADSMFRVAQIVGENMRMMQERHREGMEAQGDHCRRTTQRRQCPPVSGLHGRQFHRGHG